MILVDSSGWLEYFAGTPLGNRYAPHIEGKNEILVPTVVLYEVYRWIKRHKSEEEALKYAGKMGEGHVVALDDPLAFLAADLGLEHKLALADSIVYAAAVHFKTPLYTSDADFKGLRLVRYLPKL